MRWETGYFDPFNSGNARVALFSNRDKWPISTKRALFLGEAIIRFLMARHGPDWTIDWAKAQSVPRIPAVMCFGFDPEVYVWAARLALEKFPDYRARSERLQVFAIAARDLLLAIHTDEEWQYASAMSKTLADEAEIKISQFYSACAALKSAFADGLVQVLSRHLDGGDLSCVNPAMWHAEGIEFRFDSCRLNVEDPFNEPDPRRAPYWLFVDPNGFEQFITDQQPARLPSATKSGADECFTWLCKQMRASPDRRLLKREQFAATAKERFGLGSAKANVIWKEAVAETGSKWSEGGRPKKARLQENPITS